MHKIRKNQELNYDNNYSRIYQHSMEQFWQEEIVGITSDGNHSHAYASLSQCLVLGGNFQQDLQSSLVRDNRENQDKFQGKCEDRVLDLGFSSNPSILPSIMVIVLAKQREVTCYHMGQRRRGINTSVNIHLSSHQQRWHGINTQT